METTPRLSIRYDAHYVTAGGIYDRLLDNGPLTDHKITFYQLRGRYGKDAQERALRQKPRRGLVKVRDSARRLTLKILMKNYSI